MASVVAVDRHKRKQALGNLRDNATEASADGGLVEVQASLDDRIARIAVRDYGAGVRDDVRPRLFMPFCTTEPDGVGLGLALARELVEAHGGSVGWSTAAPGTIFTVSLPVEASR